MGKEVTNSMKRKLTLAILLLSGIVLAACSSTTTSSQGSNSTTKTSVTNQNPEFADYLSKNETIIYQLESSKPISKDIKINYLLVAKDDKITTYDLYGPNDSERLTLGEASKLSDKEVIEKATELHKQNISGYYKKIIEKIQTRIDIDQNEIDEYNENVAKYSKSATGIANGSVEEHEKRIEDYKKIITTLKNSTNLDDVSQPTSSVYSINLKTDNSGNQTAIEYFTFSSKLYNENPKNISFSNPLQSFFPTKDKNGFGIIRFDSVDIYDSTFNIGVNKDSDYKIAVRTDKDIIYKLDNPKTKLKNVTVD